MVEIGNLGSHRRIQVEVDDRDYDPNLIFLSNQLYVIISFNEHTLTLCGIASESGGELVIGMIFLLGRPRKRHRGHALCCE